MMQLGTVVDSRRFVLTIGNFTILDILTRIPLREIRVRRFSTWHLWRDARASWTLRPTPEAILGRYRRAELGQLGSADKDHPAAEPQTSRR
jgi:hypothetical protein